MHSHPQRRNRCFIPCSYILGEAQKPGTRRAPSRDPSPTHLFFHSKGTRRRTFPGLASDCLLACLRVRAALARLHRRCRRAEATRRHSRVDRTGRLDEQRIPSISTLGPPVWSSLRRCTAHYSHADRYLQTPCLPSRAWLYRKSLHVCSGQPTSRPPDPLKTPAATAVSPSPFPRPSDACAAWPPSRSPPLSQSRRPPGRTSIEKKASPQKEPSILCLPDQPRLAVARRRPIQKGGKLPSLHSLRFNSPSFFIYTL